MKAMLDTAKPHEAFDINQRIWRKCWITKYAPYKHKAGTVDGYYIQWDADTTQDQQARELGITPSSGGWIPANQIREMFSL
jgi:hypothetical protein